MSLKLKEAVEKKEVKLVNGRPPEEWNKLVCKDVSRTRQEFVNDTDINRIVDKYTKTGVLPFAGRKNLGMYADVSEIPDYGSALAFVVHAKEQFNKLDVNVRKRFHNSPQELLDFLKDENNREEAVKLGLVEKGMALEEIPPIEPEPEPEPSTPEKKGE